MTSETSGEEREHLRSDLLNNEEWLILRRVCDAAEPGRLENGVYRIAFANDPQSEDHIKKFADKFSRPRKTTEQVYKSFFRSLIETNLIEDDQRSGVFPTSDKAQYNTKHAAGGEVRVTEAQMHKLQGYKKFVEWDKTYRSATVFQPDPDSISQRKLYESDIKRKECGSFLARREEQIRTKYHGMPHTDSFKKG